MGSEPRQTKASGAIRAQHLGLEALRLAARRAHGDAERFARLGFTFNREDERIPCWDKRRNP